MVMTRACVAVVVVLCACEQADPRAEAPAPAPAVSAASPTAPEAAPSQDGWAYNPIGKRDPYRPFFPTEPPGPDACQQDPLQCFAVEQLALRGVVWGERPRALLEDPSGGSHVVEIGSYVGNSWGRVTHIESGSVVVTEEYLDGHEALVVHPIRLRLDPLG